MGFVQRLTRLVGQLTVTIDSLINRLWRFLDARLTHRVRQGSYIVMAALFLGALVFVLIKNPGIFNSLNLWAATLIALLLPVGLVINAIRYCILARILGRKMLFRQSLSIIIAGNAANFLPLPGGLLVRAAGMSEQGMGYSRGLAANVAGSLVWLGVSALFAAIGGFVLSLPVIGGSLVAGGILALILGIGQLIYWRPSFRMISALLGANFLFCIVATSRFALGLLAVGLGFQFARSVLLSVSGPLGVVTALAPGALGITEAIATALAVASGLPAAEAFAAAALIRIVSMAVLACLSLAVRHKKPDQHKS